MDTCSSSLTNSTAAACAILNRSFVLDIDAVLKEEGLINFDDDEGDGDVNGDGDDDDTYDVIGFP